MRLLPPQTQIVALFAQHLASILAFLFKRQISLAHIVVDQRCTARATDKGNETGRTTANVKRCQQHAKSGSERGRAHTQRGRARSAPMFAKHMILPQLDKVLREEVIAGAARLLRRL